MTIRLYFHPLASFCHKVLIALYEKNIEFEPLIVDLMDEQASASYFEMWPVGKIPLLRDEGAGRTVPETTIIIEYLEHTFPDTLALLPQQEQARLDARLWDRFYDLYVQVPMQKIVTDRLRAEDERDVRGVADARTLLTSAYDMIERQMMARTWALGDEFSIADCAAAPALFYAGIVHPFAGSHPRTSAYLDRLIERSSFARVLAQARPYFSMFPLREAIPQRFLAPE